VILQKENWAGVIHFDQALKREPSGRADDTWQFEFGKFRKFGELE